MFCKRCFRKYAPENLLGNCDSPPSSNMFALLLAIYKWTNLKIFICEDTWQCIFLGYIHKYVTPCEGSDILYYKKLEFLLIII